MPVILNAVKDLVIRGWGTTPMPSPLGKVDLAENACILRQRRMRSSRDQPRASVGIQARSHTRRTSSVICSANAACRGSSAPFDGGLPARSTGAYRPVLAENSTLCCFPGARTTENSTLCCFPGARTTENALLASFPGARCHCGGVPYRPRCARPLPH